MSQAIKFGRWLLRNATPVFENGLLCWMYNEEETFDTDELYKIFLDENKI